jgi:hypothetical protein
MIEQTTTLRWSILEIIDAHSLDFYRARALTCILCPNPERLETLEIRDAIAYLEHAVATPSAVLAADVLADMPGDGAAAQDMTGAAIAEAYGITEPFIIAAITAMLSDPTEVSNVAVLSRRVCDAIAHLRDYLDEQEEDGDAIIHESIVIF